MIRLAMVLIAGAFACAAVAQPLPDAQRALFLEFASDVSGNDADVMARAKALIETPPTTLEEIGFYGMENAPPPERVLRGIISALGNEGHILQFEDKYIYEMPLVLADEGLAAFEDPLLKDPVNLFGASIAPDSAPTDAQWRTFRANFGPHVRAIETAVRQTGHELLSLNLPLGDTMFIWIATPDQARTWRNRQLYAGVNTQRYARSPVVSITVSDPAWNVYWGFLTYAFHVPEAFRDVPDYE